MNLLLPSAPFLVISPPKLDYIRFLISSCENPDWFAEVKHDGYRCLLRYNQGQIRLYTKTGKIHNLPRTFTIALLALLRRFDVHSLTLDGEVLGFTQDGKEDFRYIIRQDGVRRFYAFDLLNLNGISLMELALADRKDHLKRLISRLDPDEFLFRYVPAVTETIPKLELATRMYREGLEGLVFKNRNGKYGDLKLPWYKFKNPEYRKHFFRR